MNQRIASGDIDSEALLPVVVLLATTVMTGDDLRALQWPVLWLVAGGIALEAFAGDLIPQTVRVVLAAGLIALSMVMKGLPLAYSKDMQEDKEQVFDAADNLILSLAAMEGMVRDLTANVPVLEAAAASGFSTATDLADWLVREAGLPFRDAHHATGALVAAAEKRGVDLPELTLVEMQAVNSAITQQVYEVLGVHNSVASRQSYGGTAPDQVRAQIARWKGVMEGWE